MNVYERVTRHHLMVVAGGVAFFAFLSIFPALASVVSIYGLITDASSVEQDIARLTSFIPQEVRELLFGSMKEIATTKVSTHIFGLVISVFLSLWSANKAMKAANEGLNITYETNEDRGFIKVNIITFILTLLTSIVMILVIGVAVLLPIVVSHFLSQGAAEIMILIFSWTLLIIVIMGLVTILYRFAPARAVRPPISHMLPGVIFTTVTIIITSIGFSFYVSNFSTFDEEYGALGAVVITMLWLYLVSYIFLVGAEINARLQPFRCPSHTR